MPGENCAIVGCSNNRWHKDTTLFKLPTANPTDETKHELEKGSAKCHYQRQGSS